LKADVWVTYGDIHLAINRRPVRIVGYGMYGNVQNSDQLSTANRNLSNNLDVKRTPVAKNAAGLYLEAGYDILSFWSQQRNENLYVFARIEWYDSMYKTVGNISDNPRYERTVFNLGINYLPLSSIVLKAHYNWRTLGSGEQDETLALGIGFDF
ncbi:MAG: hypothetical protein KDC53_15015, partial [Saprospiraceae bacterium]|nr:hypothetical protein [Saprospiraceae bacterium]